MTAVAPTLPDLSAIKSVVGMQNATTDSVIAGLSTGAFAGPSGAVSARGPATIVDLSDHAKAILAKDATDQVAAQKLAAQVEASRASKGGPDQTDKQATANKSIFDQIHDLGSELTDTNLYAGLEEGARVIDSAAGGLGGCPYAPGATGNVATEDVVYMLEGMGVSMGVDMDKLIAATNSVAALLGRPPVSRVVNALNAKAKRAAAAS